MLTSAAEKDVAIDEESIHGRGMCVGEVTLDGSDQGHGKKQREIVYAGGEKREVRNSTRILRMEEEGRNWGP
ncbi:unnamed protein product [Fusarium graminearum]|uniref:Uncharacterized protein n=1 Tax=Gibberella zeae TaxID=5518 RepID=A0A4U9FA79_GIBZA|nr:unnamed protein product [Fusarium graminearum]CAF3633121.1 unnamed protein product [Fusarium graminearum]CAG1973130.1 unnamed protein product [Fusarium graminearum]CAG2012753.1 unnamed protein product [Fusarium graminearum]VTO90535.1 unnamed protein product [Fusarium graminearum]